MNSDDLILRIGKAVKTVVRRLRNEDGNFDIEACWAIGILATVAEMDLDDLVKAAETYSRVVFTGAGQKIKAIKIVRTHLGCGLKNGKDIVEGTIHANASPAIAKLIKEECEHECGSEVVIHPWTLNYVNPMIIGRGLDLDDDLPPPPKGDEVPF